ncbi:MAG: acyltransferase family protein, partial [Alphaproteobacteria bacterium]|nr:acyltransferase family protein [Alphaproteobacteria bacterium]
MEKRISGVDSFRCLAFFAVVALHCLPDGVESAPSFYNVIDLLCRFAVPFYFVASGYFLAHSRRTAFGDIQKLFLRLFPVFLGWLLFYNFYFVLVGDWHEPIYPGLVADSLLSGHRGYHLWFLPALGISGVLLILIRRFHIGFILGLAGLFYLFELAFGPYKDLLGLPDVPYFSGLTFKARFGPFMSFPFMTMGYVFAKYNVRIPSSHALALAGLGLGISFDESWSLAAAGFRDIPLDAFMGTLMIGGCLFLYSLNVRGITFLRGLSPYVLGAYCVHILVLDILERFAGFRGAAWLPTNMVLVSVLSLVISYYASAVPGLQIIFG